MVWIASCSTGSLHRVLGVFPSLERAQQYVEQHAIGHPVAWAAPAGDAHAWRCSTGSAVYVLRELKHDEPRAWRLQCAGCGAAWTVTAADILAGDDWLACPRCRAGAGGPPVA